MKPKGFRCHLSHTLHWWPTNVSSVLKAPPQKNSQPTYSNTRRAINVRSMLPPRCNPYYIHIYIYIYSENALYDHSTSIHKLGDTSTMAKERTFAIASPELDTIHKCKSRELGKMTTRHDTEWIIAHHYSLDIRYRVDRRRMAINFRSQPNVPRGAVARTSNKYIRIGI